MNLAQIECEHIIRSSIRMQRRMDVWHTAYKVAESCTNQKSALKHAEVALAAFDKQFKGEKGHD
jgi:hypothetical protein